MIADNRKIDYGNNAIPPSSTCLASSSSDNSPVFLTLGPDRKKNPKSPLGRQNHVCSLVLLSSLAGLEYPYDTIFPALKRWAIVREHRR
jgi:hypothetical protein